MISLRKIFGKDDRFFRLLEDSATEAQNAVRSVSDLLRGTHQTRPMEAVTVSRRKGKELHEEISEHVIRSFVTTLDREDIEALSSALHRIPKTAEKIGGRFRLCAGDLEGFDFGPYAEILEQAVDHVKSLVQDLRRGANIEHIEAHTFRLHQIEDQANRRLHELLQMISKRHTDLRKMLVLRDLCRFLERLVDRCAEAGDVVTQIVLKNS